MATRIRTSVLALGLASPVLLSPGDALGAHGKHHRLPRLEVPRVGAHHRVRQLPLLAPQETLGERAASYARRLVGMPYVHGGDSPQSGFDCSGLVRFVYGHFGVTLPHSSYADFGLGTRIGRSSLRPGDLVFFDGVGHVGMYMGGGRFIHAPHTGTRVQVTSLDDPWYRDRYDGARRLLSPRRLFPPHRQDGSDESRREPLPHGPLRALRLRLT
jgi:hypothetical protein